VEIKQFLDRKGLAVFVECIDGIAINKEHRQAIKNGLLEEVETVTKEEVIETHTLKKGNKKWHQSDNQS
jgi:hypothetical protein